MTYEELVDKRSDILNEISQNRYGGLYFNQLGSMVNRAIILQAALDLEIMKNHKVKK